MKYSHTSIINSFAMIFLFNTKKLHNNKIKKENKILTWWFLVEYENKRILLLF